MFKKIIYIALVVILIAICGSYYLFWKDNTNKEKMYDTLQSEYQEANKKFRSFIGDINERCEELSQDRNIEEEFQDSNFIRFTCQNGQVEGNVTIAYDELFRIPHITMSFKDGHPNGTAMFYARDGNIYAKAKYEGTSGTITYLKANGIVHSEMTFGDGANADGEHVLFYDSGKVKQKRVFNNGVGERDSPPKGTGGCAL